MARLDKLSEEFPLEIDARAFLLRADTPPEGILRPPGQAGGPLSEPLRTYAEESGLVMRRAGLTPYTRLALEASEYAKTTGLFEPFHKGLYHAFWAEGKDLGKIEVVREVGEAVGLDGSELTRHLETRSYKEIIEAQYAEALQIGVTGIPAFIIGRFFFMGAQPYELFQQVAQRAQAKMEEEKDHLQP